MYQQNLLHFDQLSREQLYAVLRLRSDVFVLEQKSLYQDIDGLDERAWHILVQDENDVLVGVLRILKDPKDGSCYSIGRVAISKAGRGQGLAKELMDRAHAFIAKQEGAERIELSAQVYLTNFYKSFGYVLISDQPYDDAGVMHVDMIRAV
ncbi:GNAT family N-acetyltransferase [Kiloniella antarctica]|uniref:GNAT family N-acetyltransferase n=1 Tax=Kiloniella antarctica TaxID=1550907 RepID=A0ABW5BPW8_9PROT